MAALGARPAGGQSGFLPAPAAVGRPPERAVGIEDPAVVRVDEFDDRLEVRLLRRRGVPPGRPHIVRHQENRHP